MSSKLTILPHITVLSYLNLSNNLRLRLLSHSENKFFINKYDYFKNKKQKLQVTLDINSENSKRKWLKLSFLNHLDQVNVIGIYSLTQLIEVLEILIDIHNQNLMQYDKIKEESKLDAQSTLNQEYFDQHCKTIMIQLSFAKQLDDINDIRTIQQQQQLINLQEERKDKNFGDKFSQIYLKENQRVKFEFLFDFAYREEIINYYLTNEQSIRSIQLAQDFDIKFTTLIINKNTNIHELRFFLQKVSKLSISNDCEVISMANDNQCNLQHIKKLKLKDCNIYPFPPMFEKLESLTIIQEVNQPYMINLKKTMTNYQIRHQKQPQQDRPKLYPAFQSLKKFTGTFSFINRMDCLQLFQKTLKSIKNATKVNLKLFLQMHAYNNIDINNHLKRYCKNIEFIEHHQEINNNDLIIDDAFENNQVKDFSNSQYDGKFQINNEIEEQNQNWFQSIEFIKNSQFSEGKIKVTTNYIDFQINRS